MIIIPVATKLDLIKHRTELKRLEALRGKVVPNWWYDDAHLFSLALEDKQLLGFCYYDLYKHSANVHITVDTSLPGAGLVAKSLANTGLMKIFFSEDKFTAYARAPKDNRRAQLFAVSVGFKRVKCYNEHILYRLTKKGFIDEWRQQAERG